jgi:hypothetical protein
VTTGVTTSSSAAASAIAASSGAIYGITASSTLNTSGTVVWLNFFNVAAASVTPGSTTPLFSIPVIGTTGLPISPPWEWPIPYAALSVNCTTLRGGSTKTQNVCEYIVVRK